MKKAVLMALLGLTETYAGDVGNATKTQSIASQKPANVTSNVNSFASVAATPVKVEKNESKPALVSSPAPKAPKAPSAAVPALSQISSSS